MEPSKVIHAVNAGLKLYRDCVRNAPRYPLDAVAEYDAWFRDTFLVEVLSRLTVQKGRWIADDKAHLVIGVAGRIALDGCRSILLPVVNAWIEREYPRFWKQGLEYAKVMAEMQGMPEPDPFNESDTGQIAVLVTGEIATQADHADHHRRYVERNISAALTLGWTTERFMAAMTVPEGIVAFPFGNTRYSWKTHITRMIEGRARAVFASAAENRAMKWSPCTRLSAGSCPEKP